MQKFPRRRIAIATVLVTISTLTAAGFVTSSDGAANAATASESARMKARGLEAGYNLDHEDALAAFRAASELNPEDPAPHRLIAATLWINTLFHQGAVTIEDYLGQARTTVKRKPPSPDLDREFRSRIERALTLAEERLRKNPADADARFQIGAAHSFLASYVGTVEGRSLAAFRAARRAYAEHERVLDLEPARKDAAFVVGTYRYGVSTLPVYWRLVAGIAGIGGGRERGLRLIEESAAYPSDVQTNALFMLVLVYNREQRYDDALRVVGALRRKYPRNRLLWLEEAGTNLRAGRPRQALAALEEGYAKFAGDPRPRAFGEQARWRYSLGAALVGVKQVDRAASELRAVLRIDAPGWLRGRAHVELGKLADLAGSRQLAIDEYRVAQRIGRDEDDAASEEEAARLLKAAYRGPS
jgi:hypothetical protein